MVERRKLSSFRKRQRLEVSENVKYIAVTSRASKLQFGFSWIRTRDHRVSHLSKEN